MNEMCFLFALGTLFGAIAYVANRDEAIREQRMEDMKVDHLQTANAMLYCTRNECERLIDAFYGRWSGVIDEWELSNRTAALYKRIIETQKQREEMIERQKRYRKP